MRAVKNFLHSRALGAALCLAVAAFLVAGSSAGFAQESDSNFEEEFAAFKRKIDAVKSGQQDGGEAAPANPLGPAAGLPVAGNVPATANALMPTTPEELQAQIDAEAEEQKRQLEEETFKAAIKQLLPLEPEQIRRLYEEFKISREAAETPIFDPKTTSRVKTISLDPTQDPPEIRLAPGYVTTVNILDSSGAPWPIQDLSFAGKFTIQPPENGGHVLRITPQAAHGVGNISLRLVDLITPVIFTVVTGLDEVDYRLDARIAKPGPLAKTPIIEFGGLGITAGEDGNLTAVLDGTIPDGAEKLILEGVDGRTTAWRLNGSIYLRTPLSLLSPAWNSSVASADGTTVYTLNDTPVILLSDNGRMAQARIVSAEELVR